MTRRRAETSTGASAAPRSWWGTPAERVGVAVGVAFGLMLRLVLMHRSPLHLFAAEEFANLRLVGQLEAGLPLGPLSQYAYGDGIGLNGGGSLVLSLLYVPLEPLFGDGLVAVRVMALLWAAAGALLVAALGRRLLGPWGGVAALGSLLAMPPSYWLHSSVAWGNHAEGGVLVLAAAAATLAALSGERVAPRLGAGALWGFAGWFWPPAWVPAGLLGVLALDRLPGAAARLQFVGGAVVGSLPWVLVSFSTESQSGGAAVAGAATLLGEAVARPAEGLAVLVRAWRSVPVYAVDWVGRWQPSAGWTEVGAPVLRALVAVGLGRMLLAGRNRRRSGEVAAMLAVAAVLIPLGLELNAAAAPRRLTAIYPLWALGLGGLVLGAWARGRVGQAASVGLLGLGLVPTVLLAFSGSRPAEPFDPAAFAMCPGPTPALSSGTCLRDLSEAHLPLLHWIGEDPRLQAAPARTAALKGFDAATGMASNFVLVRALAPCPTQHVRVPRLLLGEHEQRLAWEVFGAALAISCGAPDAERRCGEEAEDEDLVACRRGVGWSPPE